MPRIIIDKAALEAREPAIQVVDGDKRTNYRRVDVIALHAIIGTFSQYDVPQQDGTRIEFNTNLTVEGE